MPQRISHLEVKFEVMQTPAGAKDYRGSADIQIVFSDQSNKHRLIPDLTPHLSASQKTAIVSFMNAMLAKAEQEIL